MSLSTSPEYEASVKARRLFATLTEEAQQLQKHAETILGAASAMRTSLGNAMFAIARLEALYVDQTQARRKLDKELFAATVQVKDLILRTSSQAAEAAAAVTDRATKVDGLKSQAERIALDRHMEPEPGRIKGVEYVGIEYIAGSLDVSVKSVRRYMEEGAIDPPDLEEADGGRPKQLWAKPNADVTILRIKKNRKAA